MRIAICDDEEVFRTYLRNLLALDSFTGGTDIQVTEYAGGEALLADLETAAESLDVVFLDIRMPGMDGLETARLLRQRGEKCLIVFLTSLLEYARKGYEVRAFRYLLKEEAEWELSWCDIVDGEPDEVGRPVFFCLCGRRGVCCRGRGILPVFLPAGCVKRRISSGLRAYLFSSSSGQVLWIYFSSDV